MGYTHYWNVNKIRGQASQQEKDYQLAIRQCQRIILKYNKEMKDLDLKHPDRLSGYSAHTKVKQYGGLNINGVGELAHETFSMREHFGENESDFCKTALKPYDTVVVACLITLKHYLGQGFSVDSDGDAADWQAGLELAKRVTRIKTLKIPASIRNSEVA